MNWQGKWKLRFAVARAAAKAMVSGFHRLGSVITCVALVSLVTVSPVQADFAITDIAGRQLELERPATRIVLAAPSYYPALSLLSPNAAELIVGIGGLEDSDPSEMQRDLAGKPRVGWMGSGTFSVERVLELMPDVVVTAQVPAGTSPQEEAILAKAGIAVVYVDFYFDPSRNTVPSIEILGRVLGEEKKAADYIDFHRSRIDRILARLADKKVFGPRLFVNPRSAGQECCWASGNVGVMKYFDRLSVSNISDGKVPGSVGQLSPEYVMQRDPEVFIALDAASGRNSLFGDPRSAVTARAGLKTLLSHPVLQIMAATRESRVHVIDDALMYSPLNVLTVEVFAKWLHPALFPDVDPQATLTEINSRFLARPLDGPFWASLDPAADLTVGKDR